MFNIYFRSIHGIHGEFPLNPSIQQSAYANMENMIINYGEILKILKTLNIFGIYSKYIENVEHSKQIPEFTRSDNPAQQQTLPFDAILW